MKTTICIVAFAVCPLLVGGQAFATDTGSGVESAGFAADASGGSRVVGEWDWREIPISIHATNATFSAICKTIADGINENAGVTTNRPSFEIKWSRPEDPETDWLPDCPVTMVVTNVPAEKALRALAMICNLAGRPTDSGVAFEPRRPGQAFWIDDESPILETEPDQPDGVRLR